MITPSAKILGLIVLVPFIALGLLVHVPARDDWYFRGFGGVCLVFFAGLLYSLLKSGKAAEASPEDAPAETNSAPTRPPPLPAPTAEPFERDGILHFHYFKAPRSLIDRLKSGRVCDLCGQPGECLQFPKMWRTRVDPMVSIPRLNGPPPISGVASSAKDDDQVCLTCLHRGEVLYCHSTDLGRLTPDGFEQRIPMAEQKRITAHALNELLRTPPIKTEQEEIWLTHCDDFMDFIGTWAREDFIRSAADGAGERIYNEIMSLSTDVGDADATWENWDKSGETFYVFTCRHCGKCRGYSQLD